MIIVLNRSSILQWFGVQSEPLTLMDCLYAFFLTDELQRESKRIDTARRVLFVLTCVCVCVCVYVNRSIQLPALHAPAERREILLSVESARDIVHQFETIPPRRTRQ